MKSCMKAAQLGRRATGNSTIRMQPFRATGPVRLVGSFTRVSDSFSAHSRSHRELDIGDCPMSRMSGTATAGKTPLRTNCRTASTVETKRLEQHTLAVIRLLTTRLGAEQTLAIGRCLFLNLPPFASWKRAAGQLAGRSVSSGASPAHVLSRDTNHTETTPKQITKRIPKASLTKDKSRESQLGPTTPNARGIPSWLFRLEEFVFPF